VGKMGGTIFQIFLRKVEAILAGCQLTRIACSFTFVSLVQRHLRDTLIKLSIGVGRKRFSSYKDIWAQDKV
jgi:hypothetical protein